MREAMLRVRWRLLIGAASFGAAVMLTLPAAASKVDLVQKVAEIWPNLQVSEIWPNLVDTGSLASVGPIWMIETAAGLRTSNH